MSRLKHKADHRSIAEEREKFKTTQNSKSNNEKLVK